MMIKKKKKVWLYKNTRQWPFITVWLLIKQTGNLGGFKLMMKIAPKKKKKMSKTILSQCLVIKAKLLPFKHALGVYMYTLEFICKSTKF